MVAHIHDRVSPTPNNYDISTRERLWLEKIVVIFCLMTKEQTPNISSLFRKRGSVFLSDSHHVRENDAITDCNLDLLYGNECVRIRISGLRWARRTWPSGAGRSPAGWRWSPGTRCPRRPPWPPGRRSGSPPPPCRGWGPPPGSPRPAAGRPWPGAPPPPTAPTAAAGGRATGGPRCRSAAASPAPCRTTGRTASTHSAPAPGAPSSRPAWGSTRSAGDPWPPPPTGRPGGTSCTQTPPPCRRSGSAAAPGAAATTRGPRPPRTAGGRSCRGRTRARWWPAAAPAPIAAVKGGYPPSGEAAVVAAAELADDVAAAGPAGHLLEHTSPQSVSTSLHFGLRRTVLKASRLFSRKPRAIDLF